MESHSRPALDSARQGRVLEIQGRLLGGRISAECRHSDIAKHAAEGGRIVILKGVFPEAQIAALRAAIISWRRLASPIDGDLFEGNYHRHRIMVSGIQQTPHLFHDHNFNDIATLEPALQVHLRALFEPLTALYSDVTGREHTLGVPPAGPFLHPQVIQYPSGGGYFGRHRHERLPQMLGFIVGLSSHGKDYPNGGTVFEIDGDLVSLEPHHALGDVCVFRFDYPHWVTQSDLRHKFDWNADDGRWVATLPYYDSRRQV